MKRFFVWVLIVCVFLVSCDRSGDDLPDLPNGETDVPVVSDPADAYQAHTPQNLKAVWLSQWDMQRVYLDRTTQREETDFLVCAKQIFANAKEDGFNTVFLQVRPFGDSFYPSELYPPSKMVVGDYGSDFAYDPIAILVQEAHAQGLSIHAWINPLRLMTGEEIESVPLKYQIRQWYDDASLRGQYLVLQGDGRWYLNPGYQEVRELIVQGAEELMTAYPFDGLHMDDYFYPTTSAQYDAQCFAAYTSSGGEMTLGDFRRAAISELVRDLRAVTHKAREDALFGIAPGGNADRAYSAQYADVFLWCSTEGYIDYICPEIYFGFEHESYPFDKTADQWAAMVTAESVRLYIGLSFHKASSGFDQYAGSGAYEWAEHDDILFRSLDYAAKLERCSGVAVFSYQHFRNALTGEVPEYPAKERSAFMPLWKQVVFPAANKN